MTKKIKVGIVGIVGRPNAGKSTFLNALIGENVSLVASSPQATRRSIKGIYQDEDSQIIFIDLPGYHKTESVISRALMKEFESWLRNVDMILHFIDPSRPSGEEQSSLQERLSFLSNKPVFTVYTKSDLRSIQVIPVWETIFRISSNDPVSFWPLLSSIKDRLTVWEPLYDEDYYTDQDIFIRASEIIRQQVIENLQEELPHAVAVDVTQFDIDEDGKAQSIFAYIVVESDSQKGIILGKQASRLVEVREKARLILNSVFDRHTRLFLRVKVVKNWRKNEQFINEVVFGNRK